jgi:Protease inhibitor Inh
VNRTYGRSHRRQYRQTAFSEMINLRRKVHIRVGANAFAVVLAFAALTACTNTERFGAPPPEQAASLPTPPPPPPSPPPVDLAGKWKLSIAGGGGCAMTLGDTSGAAEGSVAPAGGCPGSFFTSRKWTYEHDRLIIRSHKGEVLVELSFANGRFEGQGLSGGAVTLSR